MITCLLKYTIDPDKVDEFENYAKMWIKLVRNMGGEHHGYLLPFEGANNIGYATFSFENLAEYEQYRTNITNCSECQAALAYAQRTGCIMNYDRTFLRPVYE